VESNQPAHPDSQMMMAWGEVIKLNLAHHQTSSGVGTRCRRPNSAAMRWVYNNACHRVIDRSHCKDFVAEAWECFGVSASSLAVQCSSEVVAVRYAGRRDVLAGAIAVPRRATA
jgi:hypothetical protein